MAYHHSQNSERNINTVPQSTIRKRNYWLLCLLPLMLTDSEYVKHIQECHFLESKVGCHGMTDLALQCHGNDIPQA